MPQRVDQSMQQVAASFSTALWKALTTPLRLAPPWPKPRWGELLAWRFPKKIGESGRKWLDESGGVLRGHGGDNFLLSQGSRYALERPRPLQPTAPLPS